MYQNEAGETFEQEADVFILACGAVETARLLLLSQSARFPNGLANGSDLVGRNVTFHEYSSAIGLFDDPIYAWAGGGYVSASRSSSTTTTIRAGFVSGGHIACAGVGIPLPINWGLPDRPLWGADAKTMDRSSSTTAWRWRWCVHDMPQHDNRVELDDKVTDAWGLPVARITLTTHENDLAMGRFLVDRDADILEAAGATKVYRVYPERVTGNCSHQHGTTRMGNDPDTSVLNKYCQAHEVDNLFVVDGGAVPDRYRRKPDPDDHGQRLAGRRPYRRYPRQRHQRREGQIDFDEPSDNPVHRSMGRPAVRGSRKTGRRVGVRRTGNRLLGRPPRRRTRSGRRPLHRQPPGDT